VDGFNPDGWMLFRVKVDADAGPADFLGPLGK
jgi:hypothetical protein